MNGSRLSSSLSNDGSLIDEIRMARQTYLERGGGDLAIMAHLAELEKEAAGISFAADKAISDKRVNQLAQNDVSGASKRSTFKKLDELEDKLKRTEKDVAVNNIRRNLDALTLTHEFNRMPVATIPAVVIPSWRATIDHNLPHCSSTGFAILYDFVTGLPYESACVQLSVAIYVVRKGIGHYGQPIFLDPVYTVPASDLQMLRMAFIGAKQPITQCLPDSNTCLIIELLASNTYTPGVTLAWAKVDLFDNRRQFLTGSWRVPFYNLPIQPDAGSSSLTKFGSSEVFVRLAVSALDSVVSPAIPPAESYMPSSRQLVTKPVVETKQEARQSEYDSNAVEEELPAMTIEIDRIKGAERIRCQLRLTAYHQTTGMVMKTLSSDPISCVTTIVNSAHRHNYLVFGGQKQSFVGIHLEGDEILVARLYMIVQKTYGEQEYDQQFMSSTFEEEQDVFTGEILVAWGALKLCAPQKKGGQFDLQDIHLNTGSHLVSLFCPPVPDIRFISKRGITSGERYYKADLRLKITDRPSRRGSVTPSEDSDDPQCPQEAWILHERPGPPLKPFTATDGFDLYIDSCRFLPENVTVTRVSGSVLDKQYSKVGCAMSCVAKLESDIHNPVYGFRVEFREPAIPPTSTLIIKVYTIEPVSGSSIIIGYALLNIFVETGTTRQPIADAGMQVSLNEGAHQLRLCTEGPEGTEPLSVACILNKRRVPCATILVRLVKAVIGPLGKPLEADKVPHVDWVRLGLFRPMPNYTDGIYYSSSCRPSKGEQLMLCAMQDRPHVTIREILKSKVADPRDLKRYQTNAELEAYLQKRFNDIMDKVPIDYDLTLIVPFSPQQGIKVSVDRARNLPWSNFTAVLVCCNSPAAFYKNELQTVFDKPVFIHRLNLSSSNKDPIWNDGFTHLKNRSYHRFLTIIFHLREIEVKIIHDGYNYSLRDEAWTAVQVFTGNFVNTSYYQLPLIHGSPSAEFLQELEVEPVKEWIAKSARNDKIRLVSEASVLIRLCDGRRGDELSTELPDGIKTKFDVSYLPVNARSGYQKYGGGKQLLSMLPEGKEPEEFSESFGSQFKRLVYKLYTTNDDQQ